MAELFALIFLYFLGLYVTASTPNSKLVEECLQKFNMSPDDVIVKDVDFHKVKPFQMILWKKSLEKDIVTRNIYYKGHWESTIAHLILENLDERGTLLDIGGNVGWHSCIVW